MPDTPAVVVVTGANGLVGSRVCAALVERGASVTTGGSRIDGAGTFFEATVLTDVQEGSDLLREEIFAQQKQIGVIPADAQLTPRPAEIPAWDEMPDELKPVLRRQMEVYAAFLEFIDHHVGRPPSGQRHLPR